MLDKFFSCLLGPTTVIGKDLVLGLGQKSWLLGFYVGWLENVFRPKPM